jgi:hypothetical protein
MKDVWPREVANRFNSRSGHDAQMWWDPALGEFRLVKLEMGERIQNLEQFARNAGVLGDDERMAT